MFEGEEIVHRLWIDLVYILAISYIRRILGAQVIVSDDDDEETVNLYIMKVVPSADEEDTEEFVPVEDEDLLGKLIEVVQTDFEKEAELEDEE